MMVFGISCFSWVMCLAGMVPSDKTVTVPAAADVSISTMFGGKNNNQGKEPSIGIAQVASYGGSCDTLLRFDLDRIPRGAKIRAATLKLNRAGNLTDGDLNTGATVRVTLPAKSSVWSETEVTWSNAPARGKTDLFSFRIGPETVDGRTIAYTSPELVRWVQAAVNDHGIARAGWRLYTLTNGNEGITLVSREAAFPFFGPRLMVNYEVSAEEKSKVAPAAELSTDRFVVVKSGTPFMEDFAGRIGLACNPGQSISLFWPNPLAPGQSAVCRFAAVFPKYWTFRGNNSAGIFLTPSPPNPTKKDKYPIRGEVTIQWAGSNRFTATGWAGECSGTIPDVNLQVKPVYEFYFRISRPGKSGKMVRVEFSRNGYTWTLLAEKELDGLGRPYTGIFLDCPANTNGAMIDLEAFTIIEENNE